MLYSINVLKKITLQRLLRPGTTGNNFVRNITIVIVFMEKYFNFVESVHFD